MRSKRERRIVPPAEHYQVEIRRDPDTGVVVAEQWEKEDKVHREGAPASIERDAKTGVIIRESWYRYNVLHREDGPAEVMRKPDGRIFYSAWFRDGHKVLPPQGGRNSLKPSSRSQSRRAGTPSP